MVNTEKKKALTVALIIFSVIFLMVTMDLANKLSTVNPNVQKILQTGAVK